MGERDQRRPEGRSWPMRCLSASSPARSKLVTGDPSGLVSTENPRARSEPTRSRPPGQPAGTQSQDHRARAPIQPITSRAGPGYQLSRAGAFSCSDLIGSTACCLCPARELVRWLSAAGRGAAGGSAGSHLGDEQAGAELGLVEFEQLPVVLVPDPRGKIPAQRADRSALGLPPHGSPNRRSASHRLL